MLKLAVLFSLFCFFALGFTYDDDDDDDVLRLTSDYKCRIPASMGRRYRFRPYSNFYSSIVCRKVACPEDDPYNVTIFSCNYSAVPTSCEATQDFTQDFPDCCPKCAPDDPTETTTMNYHN